MLSAQIKSNTSASLQKKAAAGQAKRRALAAPAASCLERRKSLNRPEHKLPCLSRTSETQLCVSGHSVRKPLPNQHNAYWGRKPHRLCSPRPASLCALVLPTAPCHRAAWPRSGKRHSPRRTALSGQLDCPAIPCPFAILCSLS